MNNIITIARPILNLVQALWTYKSLKSLTPPDTTLPTFTSPDQFEVSLKITEGMLTSYQDTIVKFTQTMTFPTSVTVQAGDLINNNSGSKISIIDKNKAVEHVIGQALGSQLSSLKFDKGSFPVSSQGGVTMLPDWALEALRKQFSGIIQDKSGFDDFVGKVNSTINQHNSVLTDALTDLRNQTEKYNWDNWLPVKLVKPAIFTYLSNKAMKFIDIYSNSKDISEAGGKFVQSLGTVDESGIVIPKIQHKLLDLTKSYILDSQLLGKAIVEATDILFSPIKPVDSLAHTAYTVVASLMGEGTPTHPDDVVVPKLA